MTGIIYQLVQYSKPRLVLGLWPSGRRPHPWFDFSPRSVFLAMEPLPKSFPESFLDRIWNTTAIILAIETIFSIGFAVSDNGGNAITRSTQQLDARFPDQRPVFRSVPCRRRPRRLPRPSEGFAAPARRLRAFPAHHRRVQKKGGHSTLMTVFGPAPRMNSPSLQSSSSFPSPHDPDDDL